MNEPRRGEPAGWRQVMWSIAVIAGIGCKPSAQMTVPIVVGRPECPTDSFRVTLVDTVDGAPRQTTFTYISATGPVVSHIPEFHDCQRLLRGAGKDYGPLVAVFAAFSPQPRTGARRPPVREGTPATAVTILSYDGRYSRLHIEQGFSCLYLSQAPAGDWSAWIQWVGVEEKECLNPPDSRFTSRRLDVIPVSDSFEGDDIPPVARWDWDPKNHHHYIGVRCGDQWCEVGPRGFAQSRRHDADTMPPPKTIAGKPAPGAKERARVFEVKGWYDEQRLAVPEAGGLIGTTVVGTAAPHPLLGTLNDVEEFSEKWIPAATLSLSGPLPKYKSKLNLDKGVNEVYLCHGPATECIPAGTPTPTCAVEADKQWWARIDASGGEQAYRCVTRRTHSGIPWETVPGTVRWRWIPNDETAWIRCPEGCCTID